MSIKIETLELIARNVKDRLTGSQLLELFRREGVPQTLINYPDSKYNLVSKTLVGLEMSNSDQGKDILGKLIAKFAHPLTLNGSLTESKKLVSMFNSWLQFDGMKLVWVGNELTMQSDWSKDDEVKAGEVADNDYSEITKSITKMGLDKLREYVNGYKVITSIVEKFYSDPKKPDDMLNEYYMKLAKFLKDRNQELFTNSHVLFNFEEMYLPYKNLFAAFSDLETYIVDQRGKTTQIVARMNKYYGEITELLMDLEFESSKRSEGSELIKEIQDYVDGSSLGNSKSENTMNILSFGELVLDVDRATLQFRSFDHVGISTEINTVKYLRLLMVKNGSVLSNIEAARELKLGFVEDTDKNTDFSANISTICRDLKKMLKGAGMTKEDIRQFIVSVPKVGYKLVTIEKS